MGLGVKSPIRRRLATNRVQAVAVACGRLDARDELGSVGMAFLRSARADAREVGALDDDVDDATVQGLEEGRGTRLP